MRFVAKIQVFVYGTESVFMETPFVIIVTVVETRSKIVLVSKTAAQLQASTRRASRGMVTLSTFRFTSGSIYKTSRSRSR